MPRLVAESGGTVVGTGGLKSKEEALLQGLWVLRRKGGSCEVRVRCNFWNVKNESACHLFR